MKIRIIKGGIFGAGGEIAIGTELDVTKAPDGWVGRYEVVTPDAPKDAKPIMNPAKADDSDKPRRARPQA